MFGGLAAGWKWSDADWTPKLALDLAGGTQIILTPETLNEQEQEQITKQTINEAIAVMRKRVDSTGVSEAQVSSQGDNKIVVELPGKPEEQKEVRELVRRSASMEYRPVLTLAAANPAPELNPNESPTAEATATGTATGSATGTATASPTGSDSPTATSTAGPASTPTETTDGVVVQQFLKATTTSSPTATSTQTATATESATATATTTATATATQTAADQGPATPARTPQHGSDPAWITEELAKQFTEENCSNLNKLAGGGKTDPEKPVVTCDVTGMVKYILGPVEVRGDTVKNAYAGYERNSQGQVTNKWAVYTDFDEEGAQDLRTLTERLTPSQAPFNQFGIVLDGLVISAPRSTAMIPNGSSVISGQFTQDSATELANQIKFGALPISFKVETEEQISALLGSEQLKNGLLAGLIGLLLVVVYSLFQYRLLGLVTVASLLVAGLMTYGAISLLAWYQGYRLSLPGVTGLIVAIGITADSFIVYFERIRDELRDGRPLASAVESAWTRARRTIIISDMINFLAAGVLYFLAVGGVRGFAFTLGLTTLIDLIIVLMFTHPVIGLLGRTRFFSSGHKFSGFSEAQLTHAAAYSGRGKIRSAAERNEIEMTLAERRAAEAAKQESDVAKKEDTK